MMYWLLKQNNVLLIKLVMKSIFIEIAPLLKVNIVAIYNMSERKWVNEHGMGTQSIIIWYAHMIVFHSWRMRTFDKC